MKKYILGVFAVTALALSAVVNAQTPGYMIANYTITDLLAAQ